MRWVSISIVKRTEYCFIFCLVLKSNIRQLNHNIIKSANVYFYKDLSNCIPHLRGGGGGVVNIKLFFNYSYLFFIF